MKKDEQLRAFVAAMRRLNSINDDPGATSAQQDEENLQEYYRLGAAYKHSRAPLDGPQAIKELLAFGSEKNPREISIELRFALARLVAGKIKIKPGPRTQSPSAMKSALAAADARFISATRGLSMKKSIARTAKKFGISKARVDALIYPRASRRKLT